MAEPELPSRFDEAVIEAMLELLDAYGLPGKIGYLEADALRPSMLATVIGFVGSGIHGGLLLMASRETIAATHATEWTEPRLRDWIGELGNQALGCVRRKLLMRGLNAAMGLPIVLGAVRLDLSRIDERYSRAHLFRTSVGVVVVCIDVFVTGTLDLDWSESVGAEETRVVTF